LRAQCKRNEEQEQPWQTSVTLDQIPGTPCSNISSEFQMAARTEHWDGGIMGMALNQMIDQNNAGLGKISICSSPRLLTEIKRLRSLE
jgi:hypothetical protein